MCMYEYVSSSWVHLNQVVLLLQDVCRKTDCADACKIPSHGSLLYIIQSIHHHYIHSTIILCVT